MGRGQGGSTGYNKRTAGGIRTSSKMSKVGEIEAKHGVLGEDTPGAPERVDVRQANLQDRAAFQEKIAGHDKDGRARLNMFWDKYAKLRKAGVEIDEPEPGVLANDIERWLLESKRNQARRKQSRPVNHNLKSLEQYKSHKELHEAMRGYLTVAEAKAKTAEMAELGAKSIHQEGDYEVFDIQTPEALNDFAQGSHWCSRDLDTARRLVKAWDYRVVTKNGMPIAALKKLKDAEAALGAYEDNEPRDSILNKNDLEIMEGYADGGKQHYLMADDLAMINKAAKRFGIKGVTPNVHVMKDQQAIETELKSVGDAYIKARAEEVEAGKNQATEREKWKAAEKAADKLYFKLENMFLNITERMSPETEQWIADYFTEDGLAYVRSVGRVKAIEDKCEEDPHLAVQYSAALSKRYPGANRDKVEQAIIDAGGKTIVAYAAALNGRFKAGEEAIARDPDAVLRYIKLYGDKEGRFPGEYRQLAEQTLMEDPRDAIQYAKWRGERWLEAEPVIAKAHPFHIYGYIRDVVGGAWEEGEPGLLSKPDENLDAALAYAEKYKGRWEDLERLLLERGKGQHIVDYANKVLDGRWEEAEGKIFASPVAPRYIKNLLAEKRNMDMSAIAREAMALAERKDNTKSFVELLEELQAAHEAKEAQKSARPPVDVNEIAEKAIAGLSKMSADDAQEVAESLRKVLPEQYHDRLSAYG